MNEIRIEIPGGELVPVTITRLGTGNDAVVMASAELPRPARGFGGNQYDAIISLYEKLFG